MKDLDCYYMKKIIEAHKRNVLSKYQERSIISNEYWCIKHDPDDPNMKKVKDNTRTVYAETPHGGVKMIAHFYDKDGYPCLEENAFGIIITEYDKYDNAIFSIRSINSE